MENKLNKPYLDILKPAKKRAYNKLTKEEKERIITYHHTL